MCGPGEHAPSTLGVGLAERDEVIAFLDAAEEAAGAPLVDEWERSRLSRLTGAGPPGTHVVGERHWSPLVARVGGTVVGYAGVVHPLADDPRPSRAVGDVVVRHDGGVHGAALAALLEAAAELARDHDAEMLEVWLRHAREDEVLEAASAGFAVRRRLAVLGRDLGDPEPGSRPSGLGDEADGVRLRAWRGPEDDAAVRSVLEAAYAPGEDGRWSPAAIAERRAASWFVPDDLLLAELDGEVVGLHWCKRRDDERGEVYNLAVAPSAQGRGLGARLLDAGLARMAGSGCHEVLLWVDLANERALRLYRGAGFSSRWEDVAFERTLAR
ncbi:MAG: mycothiol synthase [Actinomycetota bacterium]